MDWLQTWVTDEYRYSVWNLLHLGYIPLIYERFTNGLDGIRTKETNTVHTAEKRTKFFHQINNFSINRDKRLW